MSLFAYHERFTSNVILKRRTKTIYGMMIDCVSLSIKNEWLDGDGKAYIHYSVADVMADIGCGKNKIYTC